MVTAYMSGCAVPDLVAEFGVHRTTVMRILERSGVTRRPNVRKLSEEQVAEAATLYASGLSTVLVGDRFNVDAETIRRAFISRGIPLRPRRGMRSA